MLTIKPVDPNQIEVMPAYHPQFRLLGSSGNRIYRHATSLQATGGAQLLRHLHALCRSLPGRGIERQRLGGRNAAGGNPGCNGLRQLEKRKLLPVSQGTQLRNLLGGVSVQSEKNSG